MHKHLNDLISNAKAMKAKYNLSSLLLGMRPKFYNITSIRNGKTYEFISIGYIQLV